MTVRWSHAFIDCILEGRLDGIASRYIGGKAVAGATVIVNLASSRVGANAVVARIVAQGGVAVAVQADVPKPDDIARLFAETKRTLGRLRRSDQQRGCL